MKTKARTCQVPDPSLWSVILELLQPSEGTNEAIQGAVVSVESLSSRAAANDGLGFLYQIVHCRQLQRHGLQQHTCSKDRENSHPFRHASRSSAGTWLTSKRNAILGGTASQGLSLTALIWSPHIFFCSWYLPELMIRLKCICKIELTDWSAGRFPRATRLLRTSTPQTQGMRIQEMVLLCLLFGFGFAAFGIVSPATSFQCAEKARGVR